MSKVISISPEDLAEMQAADAEIDSDDVCDPYLDELHKRDRVAELLRLKEEERAAWRMTPKADKTPEAYRKHLNRMNALGSRIRYHGAPPDVQAEMRRQHNENCKKYYSAAHRHDYYMANHERFLARQAEYDKIRRSKKG